jgi:DegV family protein with EDD domain
MSRTLLVTDSTSYLPEGWATELGVTVVPVQVIINGRSFDETDISQARDVVDALVAMEPVSTSRPSPQRFSDVFDSAGAAGFDHVVVVTLSAALSGTWESACLAAQAASVPVTVLDSQQIGMGLGWKVVAAARCRDSGGSPEEIAEAVAGARVHTYFSVHTLEYLRRGGRVGNLSARLGAALQVKPILTLVDGRVEAVEKVRTDARAVQRLEERALETVTEPEACIAVQHIGAPERAQSLAESLRSKLPNAQIVECPVGGVIGAHTGPGMVAVVIH